MAIPLPSPVDVVAGGAARVVDAFWAPARSVTHAVTAASTVGDIPFRSEFMPALPATEDRAREVPGSTIMSVVKFTRAAALTGDASMAPGNEAFRWPARGQPAGAPEPTRAERRCCRAETRCRAAAWRQPSRAAASVTLSRGSSPLAELGA